MARPRKLQRLQKRIDRPPICTGVGAQRVLSFFRHLTHFQGEWAGKPFRLMPWQRTVVCDVFGRRRRDGTRQIRTAFIEVPKKNGKTTWSAGLALYLLLGDEEPGAQVVCVAGDRDQARLVFDTAQYMLEAAPALRHLVQVRRYDMYVPETRSTFRVLPADAPTQHGLNLSCAVIDELHVQRSRELWDALTTGMGARRQPLTIAITTAGYDRESICYELHEYATKVRDEVIQDPSFYAFIAAASLEADWQDPATWKVANPGFGVTITEGYLRQEARRAAEMPAYQNTFRRFHLNQWTSQSTRFIDLNVWDENAGTQIDEATLVGQRGYGGLDMSTSQDLTAWVLVFPDLDDPEAFTALCRFWCPEARLHDSNNRYRASYQVWARDGWLRTTPGESIDYAAVRQAIIADFERFRFVRAAVDVNFQGYEMFRELEKAGLPVLTMRTGTYTMSPVTKELERRLILRKVRHRGDPVLRFCADNLTVKSDHLGNIVPDKATSQGRIDGVVALLMALEQAMRQGKGQSIYESRGVLVV